MSRIETGVDRLVALINKEKRITVESAAKKLGISKVVILEWAEFLEEENIISIDYKFNKTYLSERKLSDKEIKLKKKEYGSEKDAFIRKVEASIKSIETESSTLETIKQEFDRLKKDIGGEIEKVRDEVKQLQQYEYLKKNLDKDIETQVEEFHKILDRAHRDIDFEEKQQQQIIQNLEIEKRELRVKEHRLLGLEEKEKELMSRLQTILETSKQLEKSVGSEKDTIKDSETRIIELERAVNNIEKNVQEKKKTIMPMIEEAKKHEEYILKLQRDILEKAKEKTKDIESKVSEGTKAVSNFDTFFQRKAEIEKLISEIEQEKKGLIAEFELLKSKALAFDLATKSKTVDTQVKEMESELNTSVNKSEKFKVDLQRLVKLIKG